MDIEGASAIVVEEAFRIHVGLGPGLLESVYETVLARVLAKRGLQVERQKAFGFEYDGLRFDDAFRVDLLIDRSLIVELKSLESMAPAHLKQLLTYLRLVDLRMGLLINFGAPTFKEGVRRVVNNHSAMAHSRLRSNMSHRKSESDLHQPPHPSRPAASRETLIVPSRLCVFA